MNSTNAAEVKAFLSSRRERVTPDEAGLPAYGGRRRVKGLRREEVAMLAGVSVDYYVRLERGNLAGASDAVLDAISSALRLDEAEREHLFDLARAAGPTRTSAHRANPAVPWSVRALLDGMSGVPAWVRNDRHEIVAANLLGRALYAPLFDGTAERPVNTLKFTFLDPGARTFWRDYDQVAHDGVAMLQMEAGRHPHDKHLITLVGELSTQSESFRRSWASRDVKLHRSGLKRLHHPVAGNLDLTYESLPLASTPGLTVNVYTAPPESPSADGLAILGSWAASQEMRFLEVDARLLGASVGA